MTTEQNKTHVKTLPSEILEEARSNASLYFDSIHKPSSQLPSSVPAIQSFVLFSPQFYAMRKSPSWGHHGRREGSLQNFECRPQRHLEGDQERVQSTRSQGYSSSFILLFTLFFFFVLICDLGVKQYHPDMNKNPGAEDKFKQISAAYEVTPKSSPFSLF